MTSLADISYCLPQSPWCLIMGLARVWAQEYRLPFTQADLATCTD